MATKDMIAEYLTANGFWVSSIGPHQVRYQNGSAEVALPAWQNYYRAAELNHAAIVQIAGIEGISVKQLRQKIGIQDK